MPSETIPFSKERLLALPLPDAGKRDTYHDTKTQGLQLRVSASGVKTFCMYRRVKGGQPERVTLGRFPAMTVEQARKSAAALNAEIEAGANPAALKRSIRGELTFAQMFDEFLGNKRKRDGTPLAEATKEGYVVVMRDYLAPIKAKKLSSITRAEIKTIHTKVTKKSASQADRAVAVVSSVFSYAADLELFTGVNPAARVQKNPAPARDRFVQSSELPYLFEAIAESALRDFFLLSLLTGARRANVQAMAWHDIDFQAGVWRLNMTKNGTPQNVALTPEALTVLNGRKGNGSPYVFPGVGKTGHLVEPKKAWAVLLVRASTRRAIDLLALSADEQEQAWRVLNKSPNAALKRYAALAGEQRIDPAAYDMTDLRIHDLRRTLGSWQAKTGASLAIIGKSLNHKTQQATAIYARLDLDPVRQSVETATQAMLEAAGIKQSAEVVSLPTMVRNRK